MKITNAALVSAPNAATMGLKPCCIESSGVLGASVHQICGTDIFLLKWCNKIVRFKNVLFPPCRASRPILPTVQRYHQTSAQGANPAARWLTCSVAGSAVGRHIHAVLMYRRVVDSQQ